MFILESFVLLCLYQGSMFYCLLVVQIPAHELHGIAYQAALLLFTFGHVSCSSCRCIVKDV